LLQLDAGALHLLLGFSTGRNIGEECAEGLDPVRPDGGDGQLDGKLVAVPAHGCHLDAPVQQRTLARGQIPRQPATVCLPL
jgi:hypothetical protein